MIPHGEASRYNRGCRCDLCRVANAEKQREYRESVKGREPKKHGTTTGYTVHSCRCDECRKAQRDWNTEHTYGLKPEEYDQILTSQSGLCAICKGLLTDYSVIDHCHATGKVRGVLCSRCNSGIGKFKDSPEILSNAIRYLKF